MIIDALQTLAIQQLRAIDSTVRLVVIHPQYANQRLLLATILQEPAVVYLRFTGIHLTQRELSAQLENALQLDTGQRTLSGIHWLILDESDRANGDALSLFLSSLINTAADTRIVLFTRRVPEAVVKTSSLREKSCFVPVDFASMLWDYARRSNPPALLEVRAFGEGHVLLNGQLVDSWDGVLPRSLFFFLVDQGLRTRNQIFETFWPHLSVKDATNVFHVTKRKISEVLGMDLTEYVSGFYRISTNIELSYDAALFNEMIQQSAVADEAEAVKLLTQAIGLYKGPFLNSLQLDWVTSRRQDLVQLYSDALATLAKHHEEHGAKQEALGLYLRAALTSLQREDTAFHAMRLYHEFGLHPDAITVYDRLRTALKTEHNLTPSASVEDLAAQIRAAM